MVTVADTRILDPSTGEVLAFPGDVLDDEQLYRMEMLATTCRCGHDREWHLLGGCIYFVEQDTLCDCEKYRL